MGEKRSIDSNKKLKQKGRDVNLDPLLSITLMELGRIELPSKAGIDLPIVHRFIPSDPQGGNHLYPRWEDSLVIAFLASRPDASR